MILYLSDLVVSKDGCRRPTTYLYYRTRAILCENHATHFSLTIIIYYTSLRPQTVVIITGATGIDCVKSLKIRFRIAWWIWLTFFLKCLIDITTHRHRITRHIIVYRKPRHVLCLYYGNRWGCRTLFFEQKLNFSDKFIDAFDIVII